MRLELLRTRVRVILTHRQLHQTQPEDAGIKIRIRLGISGDRGHVVNATTLHAHGPLPREAVNPTGFMASHRSEFIGHPRRHEIDVAGATPRRHRASSIRLPFPKTGAAKMNLGRSKAVESDGTAHQSTGSRNPTSQWEPSQKGLFLDTPHRQSV